MAHNEFIVYDTSNSLFSIFKNKSLLTNIQSSIFDFGLSTIRQDLLRSIDYTSFSSLIISHFHLDHYKGLYRIDNNSMNIDKVVIPALPKNEYSIQAIKSFLALQLFYYSQKTGYYEPDLLHIIRKKNKKNFEVYRKSQGETFSASNTKFEVLWPNKDFLSNIDLIYSALIDIDKVLTSNPEFRRFYDDVFASKIFNDEITEITKNDPTEPRRLFDCPIRTEERNLLINASNNLIHAANDICLAFHDEERKLLFLGDLSNSALTDLFENKFNSNIKYTIILSAHHGTHYTNNSNWNKVSSCVVVHANGYQRFQSYKSNYNCWSTQQHHTYINGDFISSQYILDSILSMII